jgi:hypothetical protein
VQYIRPKGFVGIIICGGVEGGKGDGHDDPVLIRVNAIDKDNDDGDEQEEEQEAPAFAYLDQEFTEVLLYIKSPDDERHDEPDDAQGDPDRGGQGGDGEHDLRDDVRPAPMTGQVEEEEEKVIRKGEPQKTDEPFADTKGAHGQQPG